MVQFGCRGITAVGAENSVTRMFPPNGRAALVPGQRHRVVGKMKGLQVQVEVEYGKLVLVSRLNNCACLSRRIQVLVGYSLLILLSECLRSDWWTCN